MFTVATHWTPGLARLERSLQRFRVPITVLGAGEADYYGHAWRWKIFIEGVKSSSGTKVIHCDGYDSVCLAPLDEILWKFDLLSHPIVFSYEPQENPGFSLGLNPGLMIAHRDALLSVFNEKMLEEFFPNHFNDMYQIQSLYGWNPDLFRLDEQGIIFHTLGPRSPELVERGNRLINPRTGIEPSFVHAPNKWDLSRAEQWLATDVSSRSRRWNTPSAATGWASMRKPFA